MRTRSYLLVLIVLGLLVFLPVLQNGFVGDDDLQIVRNTQVHLIANVAQFFTHSTYETAGSARGGGLFYRPMMAVAFSAIYTLFGEDPLPFHLFQLLLHIANAILLFYFLKKLLPELTAFLCALFFLIIPINVEAVAYSANLQEVLYFFFGMLALLILQRGKGTKDIAWASLFLFLSLLSKESGVLFLVAGLAYSYIFLKKKQLPVLAASLVGAFGLYLVFRFGIAHMGGVGGSIAPIAHASPGIRLLNIPAMLLYYLRMFFVPLSMGTAQYWIITKISLGNFFLPLIIDIAFFALLAWVGKGKTHLFFLIWFVTGLLLHLQIIPLDVTVADRWMYFASAGLIALLASIPKKWPRAIVGVLIILVCMYSVLTFMRVMQWHDELTLYDHDIHTTPRNYVLDDAYASALINDGQFEPAKPYLESSIAQYPYASNLNNMAAVLLSEKNIDGSDEYLQKAIAASDNFSVYENYANFLLYYRSAKAAIVFTQEALKKFPASPKLKATLEKAQSVPPAKQNAPLPTGGF